MKKQVQKRDGSIKMYEEGKVVRVVKTAGLSTDQAHTLSVRVTNWIHSLPDTTVSSLLIRDKVLELLMVEDKDAADLYRWYEKTKEIPQQKI